MVTQSRAERFGLAVANILRDFEDWNADTFEMITAAAEEIGFPLFDCNGLRIVPAGERCERPDDFPDGSRVPDPDDFHAFDVAGGL